MYLREVLLNRIKTDPECDIRVLDLKIKNYWKKLKSAFSIYYFEGELEIDQIQNVVSQVA